MGVFFFQAEDGIRDSSVTGVQTCALPISGQVIAQNSRDPMFPPKVLRSRKEEGRKIRIAEFETPDQEAHWVPSEIERIHASGRRWSHFAVLYRMHSHRDALVRELARRKVPFVIKNLSILAHRLVRDVLAYLRLIAHPADNVTCARVLAAPAWGFEPPDLMRLCGRAWKSKRTPLYDALQAPQSELPFTAARNTSELTAFLARLRATLKPRSATELLVRPREWVGVAPHAGPGEVKELQADTG